MEYLLRRRHRVLLGASQIARLFVQFGVLKTLNEQRQDCLVGGQFVRMSQGQTLFPAARFLVRSLRPFLTGFQFMPLTTVMLTI